MAKQFILMGDIIKSSKYEVRELQKQFKHLVSSCNSDLSIKILSPYTITLGDEFQGVVKSLSSAVESIFYFEEYKLKRSQLFTLRYVTYYGEIDTPLNRKIAYGMLGKGLTRARQILSSRKKDRPRFSFHLPDKNLVNQLNRMFSVLASLTENWQEKDYLLISDMLVNNNNAEVGDKHGKNRSQIWKRRKHLFIDNYKTIKDVIFDLIKDFKV